MMVIVVYGTAYILVDNKYVLFDTTVPDSTLKNESKFFAYHHVREGTARNKWSMVYVNTH